MTSYSRIESQSLVFYNILRSSYQLTYSINGIIGGAMVAVCTLAMFVRRINSKVPEIVCLFTLLGVRLLCNF